MDAGVGTLRVAERRERKLDSLELEVHALRGLQSVEPREHTLVTVHADFFSHLLAPYTAKADQLSPFDKAKLVEEFLGRLSRIENPVLRTNYATLLADATQDGEAGHE